MAVPLSETNARQQWCHTPAIVQASVECRVGQQVTLHVHTLGLSDNLCVGASCPQNLGVIFSLRGDICWSFNLYKALFQSQPGEDGQRTPSTGALWAHGSVGLKAGKPLREPGEEKNNQRCPRKGKLLERSWGG